MRSSTVLNLSIWLAFPGQDSKTKRSEFTFKEFLHPLGQERVIFLNLKFVPKFKTTLAAGFCNLMCPFQVLLNLTGLGFKSLTFSNFFSVKKVDSSWLNYEWIVENFLQKETSNLSSFCKQVLLPDVLTSGLYFKSFTIINYDLKVRSKLWPHLLMTLEL